MTKNAAKSVAILIFSVAIALFLGELMLRIKNSSMRNYEIEIWKYSRELTRPSPDPIINHEHIPGAKAILESVEIRINSLGLRGAETTPERKPGVRRIMLLGGSITLGWGVSESDSLAGRLIRTFPASTEVLNAGVANYNTERYARAFLSRLKDLGPTDLVIMYLPSDAEPSKAGSRNVLLRYSQLAFTSWSLLTRFAAADRRTPEARYRELYDPASPGFLAMRRSLDEIAKYARGHGVQVYLAMIPDLQSISNYRLAFVHDAMEELARILGYEFVDLRPAFANLGPADVWVLPTDPHPNALGHERMGYLISNALSRSRLPISKE